MHSAVAALVAAFILTGPGSRPEATPSFQVIVASGNPATTIKRQELAQFFLKKKSRWSDGREVVPVDQTARSTVRGAFTRSVLAAEGMEHLSEVESFWLQQVYSGRGTPPPIKASDKDVVAFVEANPGAIGYVSAAAASGSVKVLTVTE
jgi:ABC-type phosphate transport system substrate-binding protein